MKRFGLIGHQIEYSKSPIVHQKIAALRGYHVDYKIVDVKDDQLAFLIQQLKESTYQGFNVTKPYKTTIMAYLDNLTKAAKEIGAVNTVYMKDGIMFGDNTDIDGFSKALQLHNIDVSHKSVVLLGSGGAARACMMVLKQHDAHIQVLSKTPRYDDLLGNIESYKNLSLDADVYINATAIGYNPFQDLNHRFNEQQICLDINYSPIITPVMKHFSQSYNGMTMLISQAIKSQSLWYEQTIHLQDEDILKIKEALSYE